MSKDNGAWLLIMAATTVAAMVVQKNLKKKNDHLSVPIRRTPRTTVQELVSTKGTYLEYLHALDRVKHSATERTPDYYYVHHSHPRDWRRSVQDLYERIGHLEEPLCQVSGDQGDCGSSGAVQDDSIHDECHDLSNEDTNCQGSGLRPLVESHYEDLAKFCARDAAMWTN